MHPGREHGLEENALSICCHDVCQNLIPWYQLSTCDCKACTTTFGLRTIGCLPILAAAVTAAPMFAD